MQTKLLFVLFEQDNSFTNRKNSFKSCTPCSRCLPSQIEHQTCNKTADRTCRCSEGKFLDPGILYCKECSTCAVGHGVVSVCSAVKDTKCTPCPNVSCTPPYLPTYVLYLFRSSYIWFRSYAHHLTPPYVCFHHLEQSILLGSICHDTRSGLDSSNNLFMK